MSERVRVIDSHTAGEPTRVVIEGAPTLRGATLAEQRDDFASRCDAFRRGVILEPRGHEVLVGALLVEPCDPSCVVGVIFFNNVGVLGMCGHGLIGVVVTLAHLGRLDAGTHRIDTPAGVVTATLDGRHRVTFQNVPSYREAAGIAVELPGRSALRGDVAWGGNWFFLTEDHGFQLELAEVAELTDFALEVREAVRRDHPLVDHVELTGPAHGAGADGRNFVLCPGAAYDRSPCGTGTSAKLACLFADGKLALDQRWRQESILGTVFEGSVSLDESGQVLPTLTGEAFVTAEAELHFDPADPFRNGIAP
jgi:4-hydroxyproline epimerase